MGERIKLRQKKPGARVNHKIIALNKTKSHSNQSPVDRILKLQKTIGNQAVTRLIQTGAIQASLKIGQPGDIYEQEADRVADQVMRMRMPETGCPECEEQVAGVQRQAEEEEEEKIQTKPLAEQITPLVQRQAVPEEEEEPVQAKMMENSQLQRQEEEEEQISPKASGNSAAVSSNIESRIQSMKSGGQPLSDSIKAFFEPRFGADFSQVRVHTDSQAGETARSINAKAFTTGKDIVFGSGQYSPGTSAGKRILAHELTHVVQQRGGRTTAVQGKERSLDREDEFKTKRKPVISFSVVRSGPFPSARSEVKRQACPPAAPARQRHRHLNATAAQIAAMGANTWGIMAPDRLGIATRTCRDGANWRLVITRVNSVVRTHSRLLPGVAEPVPGRNTTAANFCNQVTDLDSLTAGANDWYMIRAVRAHEDVHIDEWRDNFTADWTPLENAVEALTVPAAGATATRAAATTALRGNPVFTNARDTSNAGGNFPTFWGIPDPNAQTRAAERAVVNPRIRWICRFAGWRNWNPAGCAIC